MRRVRAIYYARMLKKPATRVGAVGALVVALANVVSLPSIAVNAFAVSSFAGLMNFALVAFVSTTLFVQASLVALVGLVVWFTVDGLKRLERVIIPDGEPAAVTVSH